MVENRIVNTSHVYFIKSALQIVCQCSLTRAHVRFKEIQLNESCTKYDLINARVTAGIAIALCHWSRHTRYVPCISTFVAAASPTTGDITFNRGRNTLSCTLCFSLCILVSCFYAISVTRLKIWSSTRVQCYAEPNDVFLESPPTFRAVLRVNTFLVGIFRNVVL